MSSISFDCRTQSNSIHGLSSIEFDWVRLKFSSIGFDLLCRVNRKCKPAVPSMAHRRLQHIPSLLVSIISPFITFEIQIWLILHSIREFTLLRNLQCRTTNLLMLPLATQKEPHFTLFELWFCCIYYMHGKCLSFDHTNSFVS